MERYEESHLSESDHNETGKRSDFWMRPALVALLAVAGLVTVYGLHERSQVQQLQAQAAMAGNSMNQLQAQVGQLTTKLNEMNTAQTQATPQTTTPSTELSTSVSPSPVSEGNVEPAAPVTSATTAPKPATPKRATTKRRTTVDKRYSQLKSQLDAQQKQLKEAQDEIAKNRAELEGSISSTRDELNGSIAKTHEELVALEKRGERSYFEFDLTKSKQFQRYGPLTLSLRRADTKHKNYDLALIVDDNELSKKKVNLYEPIWIHTENGTQPIQVVVNRIEKNLVHGYVSAPKYKPSELAALTSSATAPPAGATPTATQPQ